MNFETMANSHVVVVHGKSIRFIDFQDGNFIHYAIMFDRFRKQQFPKVAKIVSQFKQAV